MEGRLMNAASCSPNAFFQEVEEEGREEEEEGEEEEEVR